MQSPASSATCLKPVNNLFKRYHPCSHFRTGVIFSCRGVFRGVVRGTVPMTHNVIEAGSFRTGLSGGRFQCHTMSWEPAHSEPAPASYDRDPFWCLYPAVILVRYWALSGALLGVIGALLVFTLQLNCLRTLFIICCERMSSAIFFNEQRNLFNEQGNHLKRNPFNKRGAGRKPAERRLDPSRPVT
jgi:hypothetical protein